MALNQGHQYLEKHCQKTEENVIITAITLLYYQQSGAKAFLF